MEMKMTQRDKKLLFFLAIFCIVAVGGNYLIWKPFQERQGLEAQLLDLQLKQAEVQMQLATKPTFTAQIAQAREQLAQMAPTLPMAIQAEELDVYVTTQMVERTLRPMYLRLTNLQEETTDALVRYPVSIGMSGSLENVFSLLTTLQKLSYNQIEQFTFGLGDGNLFQMDMTFAYMAPDLLGVDGNE